MYIYRNDRLIDFPGWKKILKHDPHITCLRWELHFPPSLDEVFQLDPSKREIQLPRVLFDQMTKISFILRTLLILLIFHGGFCNYVYRDIFETQNKIFNKDIFYKYIFVIVILASLIVVIFPKFSEIMNLNYDIDLIFLCMLSYIITWCISAYFEQYLNKFNKNKIILKYSLLSLVIYFIILYIYDISIFERLCVAMMISSMFNAFLVIRKVYLITK